MKRERSESGRGWDGVRGGMASPDPNCGLVAETLRTHRFCPGKGAGMGTPLLPAQGHSLDGFQGTLGSSAPDLT